MVDCLVRFCQFHETFRLPELQALALIEGIDLKVLDYSLDVRIAIIILVRCLHHDQLIRPVSLLSHQRSLLVGSPRPRPSLYSHPVYTRAMGDCAIRALGRPVRVCTRAIRLPRPTI